MNHTAIWCTNNDVVCFEGPLKEDERTGYAEYLYSGKTGMICAPKGILDAEDEKGRIAFEAEKTRAAEVFEKEILPQFGLNTKYQS